MTLKLNGTNSEAAPAYAGDDADTGLQCGTNQLKLVTGGSARATVDSTGQLLVGTSTSPAGVGGYGRLSPLVVQGYTGGSTAGGYMSLQRGETASGISSNDEIGILNFNESDGFTFAQIRCFADGTAGSSDYPGRLSFYTTADAASGPTERIRIDSSGTLKLVSSGGIDFSGIQTNASGMTSETLDSYEEGTWSPDIENRTSTAPSIQEGQYRKIGSQVFAYFHVNITGTLTSSSTNMRITGLPFPAKSGGSVYGVVSSMHMNNSFNVANTEAFLNGLVPPASSYVDVYFNQGSSMISFPISRFGGGNILGCIIYFVA